MPDESPIPSPLRSINGYEILELIAAGGMSRVYRGRNAAGATVAVKVIQFDEMAADYERRLRREPEIQRGVGHENIVRLIDWFRVGGEFFLVMEYIDGRSLWTIIRDDGPLPFERARVYLRQVLPALEHLHGLGIVHRDIKPANILVTLDGRAKLADFGIAKFTWQQGQTRTQLGIGTPEYMSPEQARGVGIDQRSDIYSLGITFYEMLTGRPPFTSAESTPASYSEIIQAILATPVPDPRTVRADVPSGAAALIARATAKDANDRFTDCAQMLRALDAIVDDARSPGTVILGEDARASATPAGARSVPAEYEGMRPAGGDRTSGVLTHPVLRQAVQRHPVLLALILLMLAGAVFAATKIFSDPTAMSADAPQLPPETPQQIAARTASSFREYSLAHNVELLAALYATDSVRYLGEGILSRDSVLSELREDYRALARTDSFSVILDSTRALGDTAIEVRWQTAYERLRSDSSRFSGGTRDELLLEREGGRWTIARHARRLIAGVAPDGPRASRAVSSGSRTTTSPSRSASASVPAPRKPSISVRIDRGVKVDLGKPGKGGKAKPAKAKKRRK
jgi:predicted Ser/Thr protein kinase